MKSQKKMMMTFALITFWSGKILFAQTVLETYIKEGLENNLALQQENFALNKSIVALKEAKGLFSPDVSFNASYTFANGGRTIDVPIGNLLNPIYGTLNQLTDSDNFPTNLPNAQEQLFPNKFHDTRIEVRQALFNTDIYFNYKAKESLISVQKAQRDAYEKELAKEIKKGYYQYLQTLEVLAIYDSSETVLKELVKVNQSLVRNNKVTKDAVYNAEFELSDLYSKVAEANRQKHLAKSYFNFLLNRNLEDSIIINPNIKFFNGTFETIQILQQQAVSDREELLQLKRAREANEFVYKLNKARKLPKLSVGGSLGYQGFGYNFDSNQDYRLLQFNLSMPLFTGKQNNARIQKAKIEVDKIKVREQELEKQIKVQVVDTYQNLIAARQTVKAKEAAALNASESFRIIRRKYEEQQVILVEFLEARTKFTNSQISLAIAEYNLLIKEAELQRVLAL